jgi:hypothetical protein
MDDSCCPTGLIAPRLLWLGVQSVSLEEAAEAQKIRTAPQIRKGSESEGGSPVDTAVMAILRGILRDIILAVVFAVGAVSVAQYIWWILNGHP